MADAIKQMLPVPPDQKHIKTNDLLCFPRKQYESQWFSMPPKHKHIKTNGISMPPKQQLINNGFC